MADSTKRIHRGEVVRIAEWARDGKPIEDRIFEDCQIIGPAVIVIRESSLIGATFGGTADAAFWEIPPTRKMVLGAILVRLCEFKDCRFENIGIAGSAEEIGHIRKGFGGPGA